MFNGGSPTLQGYGGSPAPVAKDSPSTHLVPLSLSSPVPKSLGIRRVHLVKGSPAIQIRGGGRSSPTKFPSSSIAQMNNGGTSTTNPGGVVRASTAMGFISTGEIKLLEEFVTFCMSKDVCQHSEASARAEELRSVAVVGVPSSNKGSCRRCLVMILASFQFPVLYGNKARRTQLALLAGSKSTCLWFCTRAQALLSRSCQFISRFSLPIVWQQKAWCWAISNVARRER